MARWETHQKLGMSVEEINRPVDWLVGAFGLSVACEVKMEKGKLRPSQLAFLSEFKGACRVLRTVDDVIELHRELREQAIRLRG